MTGKPASPTPAAIMSCAVCGERIKRGRTPGTYIHVTRLVASCDLDSDHEAVPAPSP